MQNRAFIEWLRDEINPQATPNGNAVSVDDYWPDGNGEHYYPKVFTVNGDSYRWSISSHHTKGRHLTTHYELWFFGKAFGGGKRIATGLLDKTKLRRGFRIIYEYYCAESKEGVK